MVLGEIIRVDPMPSSPSRWLTTFKDGLLHLLYPNACCLCGMLLNDQARVCQDCERLLVTDPHPVCPRCAESVGPHAANEDGCVKCRTEKLAYDRAYRLGSYEGLLREAILRLKNSRDENLAEIIGEVSAG